MGNEVGMIHEIVIDEKGRIVIPRKIRDSLGFKAGIKVKLRMDSDRLIIEKNLSPEEFIAKMRGFIKAGSNLPVSDPIDLKEIWK